MVFGRKLPIDDGFKAIERGDLSTVRRLVKDHGPDVRSENSKCPALKVACQCGRMDVVQYLVEQGADVNANANSKYESTPLCAASGCGHMDVVQYLVEQGANVNALGYTPLVEACERGRMDMVQYIVEQGADVNANASNKYWSTPLCVASGCGTLEVVQYLLEHGADENAKSCNGNTPLYAAIRFGKLEVVRHLIEYGADPKNSLHFANSKCPEAHKSKIVAFLENQPGVLKHKIFPAVKTADLETLKKCIDILGDEALHSTDESDKIGNTLLHCCGSADVAAYLLDKGCDMNARNKNGDTPLHVAVASTNHHDSTDVVEYLLDKGCDVNLQNNNGDTPLHLALASGNDNKKYNLVESLVQRRAKLDAKNKNGDTPIHLAATQGHYRVVELLLVQGSNMNAQNNSGMTPLHCASRKAHLELTRLLLNKGADHELRNNRGKTPLGAIESEFKYFFDKTWFFLKETPRDIQTIDQLLTKHAQQHQEKKEKPAQLESSLRTQNEEQRQELIRLQQEVDRLSGQLLELQQQQEQDRKQKTTTDNRPQEKAKKEKKRRKNGKNKNSETPSARKLQIALDRALIRDVFLIHTGAQKSDQISTMKYVLEQNNFSCFLDRDMKKRQHPNNTMEAHLQSCRHAIVVISKSFLERKNPCTELQYAFTKMKWLRSQGDQGWHSLWIILYDISVDDYKKSLARDGQEIAGHSQ